jgi:hypothetical protein
MAGAAERQLVNLDDDGSEWVKLGNDDAAVLMAIWLLRMPQLEGRVAWRDRVYYYYGPAAVMATDAGAAYDSLFEAMRKLQAAHAHLLQLPVLNGRSGEDA